METQMNWLCYLLFPCLFICFSSISALQEGFTIDLIHRDSSLSPLQNPSKTKWARLAEAFHRSTSRVDRFRGASDTLDAAHSSAIPANGEYLMNLSIGTPPVRLLGIADTGSDLTWTQCQPCLQCYVQRLPIFDPKQSSTFKALSCQSTACYNLDSRSTCADDGICAYVYAYGDQSHTFGELATETLTFDSAITSRKTSFPEMVIGCGHDNGGTFNDRGSGLIGLGGGRLSLISQMGDSIGGKFSHCLVPFSETTSSKMSFGSDAQVTGAGVVSTPLVKKDPGTFYYLTLESISVRNERVAYKSSSLEDLGGVVEGNIIIDSGTTLTILPEEFYVDLEAALDKAISGERADDPEGFLNLCYRSADDLDVPTITAHFSGAEIELKPINTFIQVQEDVVCFAMIPAKEIAIFGNLAQIDFLVGYDLEEGKFCFFALRRSEDQKEIRTSFISSSRRHALESAIMDAVKAGKRMKISATKRRAGIKERGRIGLIEERHDLQTEWKQRMLRELGTRKIAIEAKEE
ncbi:hypothetical protein Ancab_034988 [Ancistrocladus abbreviatus]